MKNPKIKICDSIIHPGETANLAMPIPEQYSCAPLYMPIKVIHGKTKGPCLVIFSVLTGTELNGMEITNRLIQMANPEEIRGTIIAIPVVNVYGLTHYPSMLPSGYNLADCFPGNEHGNFGERVAYLFTQEILKKADYCIELQTGGINHNILPQVYCNFDNTHSKELAKAFQTPVITNVALKGNRLRQTTEDLQIPLLVYQAGEAMRFDEHAITLGVQGVQNLLRAIDILEKAPTKEFNPIFSKDEDWIITHKGGILHPTISLGQTIKKNEVIGTVSDPFGPDISVPIKSPIEGIVVGINMTPLIHEGLPVFKIASFLDYHKAESVIEKWGQKQPDNLAQ
jgi:hypothetical protein